MIAIDDTDEEACRVWLNGIGISLTRSDDPHLPWKTQPISGDEWPIDQFRKLSMARLFWERQLMQRLREVDAAKNAVAATRAAESPEVEEMAKWARGKRQLIPEPLHQALVASELRITTCDYGEIASLLYHFGGIELSWLHQAVAEAIQESWL